MRVGETWKVAVRKFYYHKAVWFNFKEATVLDLSLGIYSLRVVDKSYMFGLFKTHKIVRAGIENVNFVERLDV